MERTRQLISLEQQDFELDFIQEYTQDDLFEDIYYEIKTFEKEILVKESLVKESLEKESLVKESLEIDEHKQEPQALTQEPQKLKQVSKEKIQNDRTSCSCSIL